MVNIDQDEIKLVLVNINLAEKKQMDIHNLILFMLKTICFLLFKMYAIIVNDNVTTSLLSYPLPSVYIRDFYGFQYLNLTPDFAPSFVIILCMIHYYYCIVKQTLQDQQYLLCCFLIHMLD